MPKMKTNSGAKKAFYAYRIGKSEEKTRFQKPHSHQKTKKQKRNLTHFGLVAPSDEKRVKALLAI